MNVSIHITWIKWIRLYVLPAISAIIMLNITRVVVTLLAIVCIFKLKYVQASHLERWTHRAHYARLTYSQWITYLWRITVIVKRIIISENSELRWREGYDLGGTYCRIHWQVLDNKVKSWITLQNILYIDVTTKI